MGDPQEDRPCSQSIESFLFNNFFSVLEIIPIEYMSMILFFFLLLLLFLLLFLVAFLVYGSSPFGCLLSYT